jgi:1-acyl-sn-glycerol-3-phosphate acyltransferase
MATALPVKVPLWQRILEIGPINALVFWGIGWIFTFFCAPFPPILRLMDSSGSRAHRFNAAWSRTLLRLIGTRVTVQGLENIDPQQAYVILSNHQSTSDIWVLAGYFPVNFRWVSKASLFWLPSIGWAMKSAGYISLKRGDPRDAVRSVEKCKEKLQQNISVLIFPEGTRSKDGSIQNFKIGGVKLAIEAQKPILPVTVIGTRDIIKKNGWQFNLKQPIHIIVDKPISASGYTKKDKDLLNQQVREVILTNFKKMR